MSYAAAPTLCPAVTAVIVIALAPALWPFLVIALFVGLVLIVACAVGGSR